ncbi:MAG: YihA family ribosome biogenesis GTP-binding protein [Alphaproteobacteria bacterium]|nr:YihA family ribosome biogenesis GTP-binding protein [Alphaproteobacteria bacterium]
MFRQDCQFVAGASTMSALPPGDLPEVAFAGRSNVGKSSLINALTGRKALARASNTPGRTQQINFFQLGADMHLADLPGYGYAVASKHKIERWNDMIRTYLRERRTLIRVCVLIDARHGIMAVDQDTMEMLDSAHVPYVVVLTKADKTKPAALSALTERIEAELKSYKGAFPNVYATSSASKAGIAELRAILAMF